MQQNCVVALQSHGQPLKKKAPLSLSTDFAAQNSEEVQSRRTHWTKRFKRYRLKDIIIIIIVVVVVVVVVVIHEDYKSGVSLQSNC